MRHPRIRPWSLVAFVVSLVACGSSEPYGRSSNEPALEGESLAQAVDALGRESVSPALRAAFLASTQVDAPPVYDATPHALGFTAPNPGRGFMSVFGSRGVEVHPNHDGQTFRAAFHATEAGCETAPLSLKDAPPVAARNRVSYRRAAGQSEISEWYLNGPLGLEQGFVIEKPLVCGDLATDADGQDLLVTLDVEGDLTPMLASDGQSIQLLSPGGVPVLSYADLYVYDANNAEVPATLELVGGRITLRVNDDGAAYPLTIDPLMATEVAQIIHNDPTANDNFGAMLDIDGDLAVVGAIAKNSFTGAAYVFYRSGGVWAQEAKLTASDGVAFDGFGSTVAISGNTVVVGTRSGTGAYFFVRNGTTWSEQQKVTVALPASSAFGNSVAIDGDTAVFATLDRTALGGSPAAGYVFVRSGTTWSLQQAVTPSGPIKIGTLSAAAVNGDTAIFGWNSAKAAYVFKRTAGVWAQQKKLLSVNPALDDEFGYSVEVQGNTAFVGAHVDATHGFNAGAVYVFDRTGSTWTNTDILFGTGIGAISYFGTDVKVSNDTLVIGARGDGALQAQYGAAWIYGRSGSTWLEQVKLVASDQAPDAGFGVSVGVSGNTALCGAHLVDTYGINTGKVYVFNVPSAIAGSCGAIPSGAACDDGDPCTYGDTCNAGVCAGIPGGDSDGDGVCDPVDNCPNAPNPSQLDLDNNGYGEACSSACIAVPLDYGSSEDACVAANLPSSNFDTLTLFASATRSSVVQFDLSILPPQTIVSSADLTVTDYYSANAATVTLHAVTAPWAETTATYNSIGNAFDPVPVGSFTSSAGKKTVSVTGLVQAWVNGSQANNGVMFRQSSGETRLHSSEYTAQGNELVPTVRICYTAPGY